MLSGVCRPLPLWAPPIRIRKTANGVKYRRFARMWDSSPFGRAVVDNSRLTPLGYRRSFFFFFYVLREQFTASSCGWACLAYRYHFFFARATGPKLRDYKNCAFLRRRYLVPARPVRASIVCALFRLQNNSRIEIAKSVVPSAAIPTAIIAFVAFACSTRRRSRNNMPADERVR